MIAETEDQLAERCGFKKQNTHFLTLLNHLIKTEWFPPTPYLAFPAYACKCLLEEIQFPIRVQIEVHMVRQYMCCMIYRRREKNKIDNVNRRDQKLKFSSQNHCMPLVSLNNLQWLFKKHTAKQIIESTIGKKINLPSVLAHSSCSWS